VTDRAQEQRAAEPAVQRGRPAGRAVTGYTLVIPPEWRKIPLRHGTDQAVRQVMDDIVSQLPRHVPPDRVRPYRRDIQTRLAALVREAQRKAGLDLYLPVLPMHGAPVGASFVVSDVSMTGHDQVEPSMITTAVASGDDAVTAVTVDGCPALRVERTAGAAPAKDVEFGSRRVDYVISVPGAPGRWLVVAFSTLGGGDPEDQIARLLAGLFDAIMSTFRWQREPA
jgi:hypothetical protein